MRAPGLKAGLPYSSYIDEGHYLHPTAHMIANDTYHGGEYQNPYEHPSLPYDAIALSAELYRLTGDTQIKAGAVATERVAVLRPDGSRQELILIGRLVILAFSVGTVLLTVLLGTRLIGRRGGLIAGTLVAFLPVLVSRSAVVTADPVVTFFTTASLLAACILAQAAASSRRLLAWAAAAGALAGMAFTSKYPAGAIILAALAVIALRRELAVAARVRLAAAAVVAEVVAAIVTMPALVLNTSQVIRDVKYEASVYNRYVDGRYWSWLTDPAQIGWLFTAVAIVGVVLLVRKRGASSTTIGWLVFAVPFATYLVAQQFQPVRNLMPLLPFLAVAAATTITDGARALGRVVPLDRRGRAAISAAATAVLVVALFLGGVRPYLASTDIVDSRTEAVDWLEQHVGPDDQVLVVEELAILPDDLARIGGQVTVVSGRSRPAQPARRRPARPHGLRLRRDRRLQARPLRPGPAGLGPAGIDRSGGLVRHRRHRPQPQQLAHQRRDRLDLPHPRETGADRGPRARIPARSAAPRRVTASTRRSAA